MSAISAHDSATHAISCLLRILINNRYVGLRLVRFWLLCVSVGWSMLAWADLPLLPETPSQQQPFRFKPLEHPQIDTIGALWAITQDKQGYIWFGGAGGVARYDGYNLKLYRHSEDDPLSLSHNYVTDLLIDRSGRLWATTLWGLNRYDTEQDHFVRYELNLQDPDTLPHNWLWGIEKDQQGNLWLATDGGGLVRLDQETDQFTQFVHQNKNTNGPNSNFILSVLADKNGVIWLGTKDAGLDRYDPKLGIFQHIPLAPFEADSFSHLKVNVLYQDHQGWIWAGTEGGVYKFRDGEPEIHHYQYSDANLNSLAGNLIRAIAEDGNDSLWIASDGGGLSQYNPDQDNFRRYAHLPKSGNGPLNNKVHAIFKDARGGMWFGHYPSGVSLLDHYAGAFTNYQYNPYDVNSLSSSDVLAVVEDGVGNFWVGTETGLNYIDRSKGTVRRYLHDPDNPKSLPADPVTCLTIDLQGRLWVGTWGGGLARFEPEEQSFKNYRPMAGQPNSMRDWSLRALLTDRFGNIWMGSGFGLSRYRPESDDFIHYENDPKDSSSILPLSVSELFEDSKGNFWLGGDLGLMIMDRSNATFKRFEHSKTDPTSILSGSAGPIGEDLAGNIWVGSSNGLNLFHPDGTFSHFTQADGLADDRIGAIVTDPQGYVWFATARGLSRFDGARKTFQNYTEKHGLAGNLYKRSTGIVTRAGELVFGSSKGLSLFNPLDLAHNKNIPPVVITDFRIFNKSVSPREENSPLRKNITLAEQLSLNHRQSVFSFQFAALNFIMPERNQYAYKLEGFDQDWVESGNRREATYTNLDPGDYLFRVRGSNNEGLWNVQGASIKLFITPPPWKTWWAYLAYVLGISSVILLFVRSQQRRVQIAEEKMEFERTVVQQLEHLDKLKDDFLANTSHELRTPLNGIIGMAEVLIDSAEEDQDPQLVHDLNMIALSGRRLAHLVNDILDFSKLKNRSIQLHTKPVNTSAVVDVVFTICSATIKNKNLELINSIDTSLPNVEADEDRLQQILYNLIGNAIKFTKEGSIELFSTLENDRLWIHVKDTGIGVPENMLQTIFESFEQVERHENRSYGGTGLGLTVTKQLVELHHGEIKVQSEEGSGSVFSFCLPISSASVDQDSPLSPTSLRTIAKTLPLNLGQEATDKLGILAPNLVATPKSRRKHSSEDIEENARFKILVVDDDAVNRQILLSQLLLKNYTVEMASGGKEALLLMENNGPFDLILLDVMMPEMSGYEVCTRIRAQYSLQELPIIFLTAKNLIEDLVDGFQLGANDFLTKPISISELSSRVRTHLELLDINRDLEVKVKQRTKEVTEANRELQTLDSIVSAIHQELRFDRLLSIILSEALRLFPAADRACFWKYDKNVQLFVLLQADHSITGGDETAAQATLSLVDIKTFYLNVDHKLVEHIYLLDRHQIADLEQPKIDLADCNSALTMAMLIEGEIIGVLVLSSQTDNEVGFRAIQLSTLERFRTHVVTALAKSKLVDLLEHHCSELHHISTTDQLTGLGNRRFLYERMQNEIEGLTRIYRQLKNSSVNTEYISGSDLIFFTMDIDHFKAINDRHGHIQGDYILAEVGKIIRETFRETDICVRWGGEEFLIVARQTHGINAPAIAEKLRSAIERHVFSYQADTSLQITCSIGFAFYPFSKSYSQLYNWEQLIDVSDKCLYAAKRSGRNIWIGVFVDNLNETTGFKEFVQAPERLINEGLVTIKTRLKSIEDIIWTIYS